MHAGQEINILKEPKPRIGVRRRKLPITGEENSGSVMSVEEMTVISVTRGLCLTMMKPNAIIFILDGVHLFAPLSDGQTLSDFISFAKN